MRIIDWSSDVCSSDLSLGLFQHAIEVMQHQQPRRLVGVEGGLQVDLGACAGLPEAVHHQLTGGAGAGGEEGQAVAARGHRKRSEEHTSELQSLMRISYAVFCLKKKTKKN